MSDVQAIRVTGCSKEGGVWTRVDLKEPELIGKRPDKADMVCEDNPLEETVPLEVLNTGNSTPNNAAEVIITCDRYDCKLHR